jgi:hypothetical protein
LALLPCFVGISLLFLYLFLFTLHHWVYI